MEMTTNNNNPRGGTRSRRVAPQNPSPQAGDHVMVGASNQSIRFRCDIGGCTKVFDTKIGLGVHKRRAHPVEMNDAIDVGRVKARWSEEEVRLLAKAEAEALKMGNVAHMNVHLVGLFPARTLESIKKRRQTEEYRALVQEYAREVEAQPGPSSQNTSMSSSGDQKLAILNKIRAITDQLVLLGNANKPMRYLIDTAKEALEGRSTEGRICIWLKRMYPLTNKPKGPCIPQHGSVGSRRKQRREEYRILQRLYEKDRGAAARLILDERANVTMPSRDDMVGFWSGIFGNARAGNIDSPDAGQANDGLDRLWSPIETDEVYASELDNGTAAGLDGVSVKSWRKVPALQRCLVYNLILLEESLEEGLCTARTVFLPKGSGELTPDKFRPLSIMSVVVRQFHKILSKRLLLNHKFDARQKAFTNCDGTMENLTILTTIIADAKMRMKQVHIASLDIRKAFDSVPHSVVIDTIRALGCPPSFVKYITRLYELAKTTLQYQGGEYEIDVLCGVLQGDPLSPLLFNAVMDHVLRNLDPDIGYNINGATFNCIAYADDIILMSSTSQGMQTIVSQACGTLNACGLEINTEKSCVLSMVPSGRDKKMKVLSRGNITVQGSTLRQVGVLDAWKYLGINFEGTKKASVGVSVCTDLAKLCRAPLKPQQRLQILKSSVLTKHLHQLVLGRVTLQRLRNLDGEIRKAVRKWLSLPNDVPLAYFYASIKSGGLGLTCFAESVPLIRKTRLEKFLVSGMIPAGTLHNSYYVNNQLDWCNKALAHIGTNVDRGMSLRHWEELLEARFDTKHLSKAKDCKASTSWVQHRSHDLSARDFVRYNHIRVGCLPSRARTQRGRTGPRECRAGCMKSETNYHIIQQCHRTHGGRILRHDRLVELIGHWLGNDSNGYDVKIEHRFKTLEGLRKPDLLITKGNNTLVLDVQVVSGTNMPRDCTSKTSKYKNVQGLTSLIQQVCASDTVEFGSFTISYKGVIHKDSAELLYKMGINEQQMFMLVTSTLRGSWLNWVRFNKMNTVNSHVP